MSIHKDRAIKAEEAHLPKKLFNDGQPLVEDVEVLSYSEYECGGYKIIRNCRRIFKHRLHSGLTAP